MRFEQIIEPVFRVRCFIIFNEYPLFLMNPREETFWKTSRPRDIDNGRRFSYFLWRISPNNVYLSLFYEIFRIDSEDYVDSSWLDEWFQIYNCNCLWLKLSKSIQDNDSDSWIRMKWIHSFPFLYFSVYLINMNEKYK